MKCVSYNIEIIRVDKKNLVICVFKKFVLNLKIWLVKSKRVEKDRLC